ncbi:MAG: transcriptional regulator [Pseudomonadota bacterium]
MFPKVRQRVLAVLFDAPERSFYMGEVIALAQSGTGAVQRELAGLSAVGILSVHKQGKQKHYQVNTQSPIFGAMRSLVGTTMGVGNVLTAALAPVARQVSAAFVHNLPNTVPGAKKPAVTVVLFGTLLADETVASAVALAMQAASNTLARQLSFTLYTPESLRIAVAQNSNFLTRLLQPSHTWLKGSENNLFGRAT